MDNPNAWDDENFPVAMFIEEPYDPSKMPMYCKSKVYDNGVEYSLEEIRARRYVISKSIPGELQPQPKETKKSLVFSFENSMIHELWSSPAVKRPVIPESFLVKEKKPAFEILEDQGVEVQEGESCKQMPIIGKTNQPSLNYPCLEDKENHPIAQNIPVESSGVSSASLKTNIEKENLFQTFIKYENREEQDCFAEAENVLKANGNLDFDVTSYTKAFNLPISSSTPFIGNRKMTSTLQKENGREFVGLGKAPAESLEFHEAAVGVVKELSVIEESSKECVSGSNGTSSGAGASTAESEHTSNRSAIDTTYSVHQNLSRIPSVMAGRSAECKTSQFSRIPCPVSKSKEMTVVATTHSKEMLPDQSSKEVAEPDELSKMFKDLVLHDDPFDQNCTNQLLKSVKVPVSEREGFYTISQRLPVLKVNSDLHLGRDLEDGGHILKSLKNIGRGAYAKVYKAASSKWQKTVAIKVQKPPCEWEFYISKEIIERVEDYKLRNCFMDVKEACFFLDGSVLISDFMEHGTLLDVINMYKVRRIKLPEVLAVYFTIAVLKIIDCLHSCHIIHGDIKPDNFLLRKIPSMIQSSSKDFQSSLQLIDLGRCIDMTLYPKNASFSVIFQKTYFQCIEMRTKKPWTYQVDFFGIVSILHCLVFGDFMDVYCKGGVWNVTKKVPRNMNQSLWNWLFDTLLNIESCTNLPNITEMIRKIEICFFSSMVNELVPASAVLRTLLNEEKSKRK